jgi:Ran GTPase-activating protein (RanGAP) involved in mRNA processing and transport
MNSLSPSPRNSRPSSTELSSFQQGVNGATENTASQLQFFSPYIQDEEMQNLAIALAKNTSLKILSFADNNISAIGAESLAKGLIGNTSLLMFELNFNENGNECVESLIKIVANNTTLRRLNIVFDVIDDNIAQSLAKAFQNNTTLNSLGLNNNEISETGFTTLIDTFIKNTTLTDISCFSSSLLLYQLGGKSTMYGLIESINERNKEKESLKEKGTLSLKLLAPELPTEITSLIAQELLITEPDAATLRRLGDLA